MQTVEIKRQIIERLLNMRRRSLKIRLSRVPFYGIAEANSECHTALEIVGSATGGKLEAVYSQECSPQDERCKTPEKTKGIMETLFESFKNASKLQVTFKMT